jgi:exopolysaccharide biosynthesis polyprenyl glycosylphosphotransferase
VLPLRQATQHASNGERGFKELLKGESRPLRTEDSLGTSAPTEIESAPEAPNSDSKRIAALALDRSPAARKTRRRGWMLRRALAAADVVGLTTALIVAEWIVAAHSGIGTFSQSAEIAGFIATLPLWIVVAKAYGLYDLDEERTDHSAPDEFSAVFHMITVCTASAAAVSYLTGLGHPTPPKLLIFWSAAIVCVISARAVARAAARRSPWYLQNTLIFGAGDVGQTIARKLLQHPEYGIRLVGFVDSRPKERRDNVGDLTVVGGSSDLREIVEQLEVERVIVAFSGDSDADTLERIRTLKDMDVQVDVVPRLYELVSPGVDVHTVEGIPLVGLPQLTLSRSSQFLKRSLDVTVASIALLVLAPFFAIIAAAIKLDSRGPVLFRQTRMGEGERTFTILKFRSMAADAEQRKHEIAHLNRHRGSDERMFKVRADPRVTRVGAFLRRTSIDELPQLLNVLRGEMSLVGPRPLILEEDSHVLEWARERLRIKPGITGLWQVLGRSDIPFGEMVQMDYLYVTSWSLGGDVKIVAKTIPRVLLSRSTT